MSDFRGYGIFPQRQSVTAATRTTILAPAVATGVVIGNATTGDLRVYPADSLDNGQTGYLVIASGYDRELLTHQARWFQPQQHAFDVEADASGTLVLVWL